MTRSVTVKATLVVLALVGVVLGFVLTRSYFLHVVGGETSACSISAYVDCDRVSASQFSTLAGLPISALGIALHATVFGLVVTSVFTRTEEVQSALAGVVLALLGIGTLVSLVFAGIAAFVVRALCIYCTGLQLTTLAAFGVAAVSLGGERRSTLAAVGNRAFLAGPVLAVLAIAAGGAGVGLLTTFGMERQAEELVFERELTNRPAVSVRTRYFDSRRFEFSIDDAPITGRGNPIELVVYADYNCPHCRDFEPALQRLTAEYSGDLEVVHKFFPLEAQCNPYLDPRAVSTSCEAAAAAYAVHRLEPALFGQYHELLFANFGQYSTEQLLAHARRAGVGDTTAISAAVSDPEVMLRLAQDVEEGVRAGVTGTPAVFLDGRRLAVERMGRGETRYSVLRAAIEEKLKQ